MSEFARHLFELMKVGDTNEFPPGFAAVEILHTDGDSYVNVSSSASESV